MLLLLWKAAGVGSDIVLLVTMIKLLPPPVAVLAQWIICDIPAVDDESSPGPLPRALVTQNFRFSLFSRFFSALAIVSS